MFFCRDKLDISPSLFMRKKKRRQRKRNGREREQKNRLGVTTMRTALVSVVLKVFLF